MLRTLLAPSLLAVLSLLAGCRGIAPIEAPAPTDDPVEEARVALGQALFFDARLSREGDVSCATCHRPDHGGAEPLATSVGTGGAVGRRNAPSAWTASLKTRLFWDGRAESLDAQALEPLYAATEMGTDEATLVAFLESRPGYVDAFARAFPAEDGITASQVARALAAYQRRLAWPGRVDRYLAGETDALSEQERAGYAYFAGNCAFCHDGFGAGGLRFEVLGAAVPWPEARATDLGRMEATGEPGHRLHFMVPSLRYVGRTAPYFHDGSVATLEEAIRLMAHHQNGDAITDAQVEDVAAFLRALDGDVLASLLTPPGAL